MQPNAHKPEQIKQWLEWASFCCGGEGGKECLLSREYHPLWEYEGLPEVEVYESEMPVLR